MKIILNLLIVLSFLLVSNTVIAGPTWFPQPAEAYKFGQMYPKAQNLLFAFDYGHALVYERLIHNRGQITDPQAFEKQILSEVMQILKNPPTIKVDEDEIAPKYVFTFPMMVDVFDWSHLLHQYVLDVLATSSDRGQAMDSRVQEIFVQYNANKRIAITDVCKTMLFMDGHYFSKEFRRKFPSFNLLIWSYHWFQIKLYEALMKPSILERDAAVEQVTNEFWELISDLPDSAYFDMMPETKNVAPIFYKRFSKVSASFDNNHMLHDIVSDIFTSAKVTDQDMRSVGITYAQMALDPEAFKSNNCK